MLCSHGDVIPELLAHLASTTGLDLGDDPRCAKAGTWVLETDYRGTVTTAGYRPAP